MKKAKTAIEEGAPKVVNKIFSEVHASSKKHVRRLSPRDAVTHGMIDYAEP